MMNGLVHTEEKEEKDAMAHLKVEGWYVSPC